MARAKVDKSYINFSAGFITESTGLVYPENSVRDMDNCDLELNGSVRRRLGTTQEVDGTLIGEGALEDTTYANNTGGPLSANPLVEAAFVTKSYDGVTGNADWTLNKVDNADAKITAVNGWPSPAFSLSSTRNGAGYMQQDVSFSSYDYASITFETSEVTGNEPGLDVVIGANSSGIGQGFFFNKNGLHFATYDSRIYSGRTVELLWGGHNYENRSKVQITLSKLDTNKWVAVVTTINPTTNDWLRSESHVIATTGDYIEFRSASSQTHTGTVIVDNIDLALSLYSESGDTGLTTVPSNLIAVSVHPWPNVGGLDGVNWVVFQIGNRLFFRDQEQTANSAEGGTVPEGSFDLNFDGPGTGFVYNTTAAESAQIRLRSAVGNGRIWFTSPATIPFYAEYDVEDDIIRLRPNGYQAPGVTASEVSGARLIRDFNGIHDGLENGEKPVSLSDEHLYNLLNQGWDSSKITAYESSTGVFPSNAQQWVLGKNSSDDFTPGLLDKQDFGSSKAPRGRRIIDALVGSKDGVAHSVTGPTNPLDWDGAFDEKSSTGFSAVAFFAGRVWYAGDTNTRRPNGVYYSRVLSTPRDSGTFMQENDPTSEHFPDLLDTDGGAIYIPEADTIIKLLAFGPGVLVMAKNGVWFIYGGDAGFTASSYNVDKISSTGCISWETAIAADQAVVFWAQNGIHVIRFDNAGSLPSVIDVSSDKIFRFYNSIPLSSRRYANGVYDQVTKRVLFFYRETDADNNPNTYNRALIYNTRTSAFSKYSMPLDSGDGSGIGGAYSRLSPTKALSLENVTLTTGEKVTLSDDETGVTTLRESEANHGLLVSLKLLYIDQTKKGLRLAEFSNRQFADFVGFPGITPANFTSYVLAATENVGDLQRYKKLTYLHSIFFRTETGFNVNDDGELVARDPSGCTVVVRWDYHNTNAGGKWSRSQRAYRYRRPYTPTDVSDSFDTGEEIVYTKVKVRGKGKALAIRYDSVDGQDFQLAGYSLAISADGV